MTEPGKKRSGILTGISLNVLVLGLVSLLNDASSEMIIPILPLFLTREGEKEKINSCGLAAP